MLTPPPRAFPSRNSLIGGSVVAVLLLLGFAVLRPMLSNDPARELKRAVPGLDPALAAHLVADTDAELAAYCEPLDAQFLIDAVGLIIDSVDSSSLAAFERSQDRLLPPIERLGEILAARGHTDGPRSLARHQRRLGSAEGLRQTRLRREVSTVYRSGRLETAAKYERIRALADSLTGDPWAAAHTESRLVELAADLGRDDLKRAHLRRGIQISRQSGLNPQLSHFLGTLADDQFAIGRADTALLLADEALDVALAAGLATQAARVHYVVAAYHRDRGEISLAAERYDEAVAVARSFDSSYAEVRALAVMLQFHADLGCWDLVGRALPRVELLLGQIPDVKEEPRQAQVWNPILRVQARYLAHVGRVAAADAVYARAAEVAATLPRNYEYASVLADWATWQIDRGNGERGLELARQGLAYAEGEGLDRDAKAFHAIIARAHVVAGRADRAAEHLALSRGGAEVEAERVLADRLLALEIAESRGDTAGGRRLADQFLHALLADLSAWGNRVETSLMLQRHDHFRERLHRRLAGDPDHGLALEMAWHQLRCYATPAAAEPAGGAVDRLLAAGHRHLAELRAWTRGGRDDRALVFATVGDRILRWQVVAGTVRCDTIPLAAVEPLLEGLPRRLAAATASATGALTPDAVHDLGRAAAVLLPAWARTDGGGRLLIGTTSAIAPLPLEACDIGDSPHYLPLAARWQTAYLHPGRAAVVPARQRHGSCVIGMPEPSPALRRRHPSLQPLPHVRAEAAEAARRLPDPVLLVGGDALEREILPQFERARIVYIAGHATHDPEMPYRSYLPCAADSTASDPAQARLTFADILARDLAGCELVVLSSCRSASGRTAGAAVGPSLADAFADAGAGGVIAARWAVADEAAAAFMSRFLDRWRGRDASSAWDALTAVRRDYLAESTGPTLKWLAYELEFGRLPR